MSPSPYPSPPLPTNPLPLSPPSPKPVVHTHIDPWEEGSKQLFGAIVEAFPRPPLLRFGDW